MNMVRAPASRAPREERGGLTSSIGDQLEIDWPRSLGFFGGLGAAAALELIPLPIALFVAGVPFLKLLNRPNAPKAQRFVSQLVDGASKPVGGDSEGTVHWADPGSQKPTRKRGSTARRRGSRTRGGKA
jgi:hypothetical protein